MVRKYVAVADHRKNQPTPNVASRVERERFPTGLVTLSTLADFHILSMPQATPRPSTRINTATGRRLRSGAALCLSVVANIRKARIAVPTNSEVNRGIGDMYSS